MSNIKCFETFLKIHSRYELQISYFPIHPLLPRLILSKEQHFSKTPWGENQECLHPCAENNTPAMMQIGTMKTFTVKQYDSWQSLSIKENICPDVSRKVWRFAGTKTSISIINFVASHQWRTKKDENRSDKMNWRGGSNSNKGRVHKKKTRKKCGLLPNWGEGGSRMVVKCQTSILEKYFFS